MAAEHDEPGEQLELAGLLSHTLDKGVMVSGQVTIAVADIDLMTLDLRLLLSGVETLLRRAAGEPGGRQVQSGGTNLAD